MPTKEEQRQLRAIKALTTVMEAFMKSHPDLANIVVEDLSFSTLPAPDAAAESDMLHTESGAKSFIARRRPVLGDYKPSQGGGGTTIFRPKPKPPR